MIYIVLHSLRTPVRRRPAYSSPGGVHPATFIHPAGGNRIQYIVLSAAAALRSIRPPSDVCTLLMYVHASLMQSDAITFFTQMSHETAETVATFLSRASRVSPRVKHK